MVDFGVHKERAFIFRRRKELCNEIPWCESSRELISNCLVLYIWGLTLLFCSDLVRPKKRITLFFFIRTKFIRTPTLRLLKKSKNISRLKKAVCS